MKLYIATSTISNGSMKSPDQNYATVLPLRRTFLQQHDIEPQDTTLLQVTYETDDFCRYQTLTDADKGDGIVKTASIKADALVVTDFNHSILLPLADCVGAVIHDPVKNILMVSHLGRHNLEQYGGRKCIDYLTEKHGCNPKNLTVWLSPAAGKDYYPLFAFNLRGLHHVATEQIISAGIPAENITVSPVDSAADPNYFSHSQFLKGKKDTDGRFAIVAVMKT